MSEILRQCMEFTTQLIEKNMEVCINIKINENFNFSFNNAKDTPAFPPRKKSPTQLKRDYLRQKVFENKMKESLSDVKTETTEIEVQNKETQTEDSSFEEKCNQTEAKEGIDSETQTELNESKIVETTEVNDKGEIHPKESQTILEFRISHDFKTWDEVTSEIFESFKLRIIGNPWLTNSERHFKTVAFVTNGSDFEDWKTEHLIQTMEF